MKDGIIISEELEGIVDKGNVFGNENIEKIPIEILIKNFKINGKILNIKIEKSTVSFKFSINVNEALHIISHTGQIDKIFSGFQNGKNIEFKNCIPLLVDVTEKEDMYICEIIIDRIE